jgi:hypothetical protein
MKGAWRREDLPYAARVRLVFGLKVRSKPSLLRMLVMLERRGLP